MVNDGWMEGGRKRKGGEEGEGEEERDGERKIEMEGGGMRTEEWGPGEERRVTIYTYT